MHQHAVLKDERYFDSISFTIYRKEILGKIGFFCPGLPAGDDAEFNLRIKKSGYRLLYTPETCVYRYSRENIKSFFWQMFRYGKNRMEINKIHACLKPAHLVPFLFIMYFFSPIVLVTFSIWSWLALWGLGLLLYSMTICLFSAKISIHTRMFRLFFVSIALYITEHFAYGTGTVAGIVSTKPIANKDVLNNES